MTELRLCLLSLLNFYFSIKPAKYLKICSSRKYTHVTFSEDCTYGKQSVTPEMKPYFWSHFLQILQQSRSRTEFKFRSALHMKSTGSLADSALSPSQQVECFCAWAMQQASLFLVWLSCVSVWPKAHWSL